MDNFISIGTDKLSFGKRIKMGTRSLDTLQFREYIVLDKNLVRPSEVDTLFIDILLLLYVA